MSIKTSSYFIILQIQTNYCALPSLIFDLLWDYKMGLSPGYPIIIDSSMSSYLNAIISYLWSYTVAQNCITVLKTDTHLLVCLLFDWLFQTVESSESFWVFNWSRELLKATRIQIKGRICYSWYVKRIKIVAPWETRVPGSVLLIEVITLRINPSMLWINEAVSLWNQ